MAIFIISIKSKEKAGGKIMGYCPHCKQQLSIHDIITEERGKGIIEKEKMYMCPHCNMILGFAMKMR